MHKIISFLKTLNPMVNKHMAFISFRIVSFFILWCVIPAIKIVFNLLRTNISPLKALLMVFPNVGYVSSLEGTCGPSSELVVCMENHPGDKDALDGWLCLNQIFTSISIRLDISSHIHPSAKSSCKRKLPYQLVTNFCCHAQYLSSARTHIHPTIARCSKLTRPNKSRRLCLLYTTSSPTIKAYASKVTLGSNAI